jgi:RNA polymerase sigma factor (sigma-70 family)
MRRICAWLAISNSKIAVTSLPRRPRPCVVSWSRTPDAGTALKRGGDRRRLDLNIEQPVEVEKSASLLALDEALERLEARDPDKAQLVKLRYFAGMTIEQAAETLAISVTTANRWWSYARAWLHEEIRPDRDLSIG